MSDPSISGPSNSESQPEPDRRARVRFPSHLETLCQPGSGRLDYAWWMSKVSDISRSGIGLILRQKFTAGTVLAVEIQNSKGDVLRTLQATVVHATAWPEGGWILGCAFVDPLTEQELQAVL